MNNRAGITLSITRGLLATSIIAIILFLLAIWGGVEYYTSQSSFCGGSCHTMSEQYAAWKANKHHASNNTVGMQADCIDCHFLPGEQHSLKAKYEGLRHLAAYLYDPTAPLPIRPVIKDGACLQSGCHNREKLAETEIQYTPKIRFKHKVHFGDSALAGQKLTCDNCHVKVTAENHFEVPKEICFLCHLKLEKPTLEKADVSSGKLKSITFANRPSIDFNQGASRCDICHQIPTAPLQSQIQEGGNNITKPITHQSIKEAGVACESCHFEIVKGAGEVNTGNVVSNGCLSCHNRSPSLLATAGDKVLMHDKHVTTHKADCFDCHSVIEHKSQTDHLDFVRADCQLCHANQHKYQKVLLAGLPVDENIAETPHLMYRVNVNCMACHLNITQIRGHAVRTASGDTCAACHTEQHKMMLERWRNQLDKELKYASEIEAEAVALLAAVQGKIDGNILKEASGMISKGSELVNIVRFGNGIHNKKYSVTIIDAAIGNFDDAMGLLEGAGTAE